jgi:hypothetical protein
MQTNITMLIIMFDNFVNAPKIVYLILVAKVA